MKIFPSGPVSLGTMAKLHLVSVMDAGPAKVARYRIVPNDSDAFTATFSGIGAWIGCRYAPVRGALWGSLEIPAQKDEIHLLVGCPHPYGVAISRARSELHPSASYVIPESSIRALLRGILEGA